MRLTDHLDADDQLSIRDSELRLEGCSLTELARRFGTPLNVVSQERLQRRARELTREFGAVWSDGPVQVLASIKANHSLALRRLLTLEGIGCDTFGFGELTAALACGVLPELISVNGSSKSPALLREAIAAGAHLTLDSLREAELVVAVAAELQTVATVRLRLRPDYSSLTLPSEFAAPHTIAEVTARYKPGLPHDDLAEAARVLRSSKWVTVAGCHAHVGRHRPDLAMWQAVIPLYVREIAAFAAAMGGEWRPRVIDVGGGLSPRRDPVGLAAAGDAGAREPTGGPAGASPGGPAGASPGARARGDEPRAVPTAADYARCIAPLLRNELRRAGLPTSGVTLQIEPGRSLYANAGLHLARVTNLKQERQGAGHVQRWVETDTSEAFLPDVNIEGVRWTVVPVARPEAEARIAGDVVGISCGFDVLVPDARLPELAPGDLLAFLDTGAYQDAGSNNFNAMPRPAMVLVHGEQAEVIRRAETGADVFRRDVVPARFGTVAGLGASGRLHHVGLVVADLDRSLAFYRDLIGLVPLGRGAETDPRYAEMLGVPRARFAWAELDLGDGHVLELLRFDEPASEAPGEAGNESLGGGGTPPRPAGPAPGRLGSVAPGAGLPGTSHFGIRVDNVEAVHEALVQSGATVVSRPIELVEDNEWLGARVFYVLDPDGHLVELIQRAAQPGPTGGKGA